MDQMRRIPKARRRYSRFVRMAADSAVATSVALALSAFTTYILFHATGIHVEAAAIVHASAACMLPTFLYIWLSFVGMAIAGQSRRRDVPLPRLRPEQL